MFLAFRGGELRIIAAGVPTTGRDVERLSHATAAPSAARSTIAGMRPLTARAACQ